MINKQQIWNKKEANDIIMTTTGTPLNKLKLKSYIKAIEKYYSKDILEREQLLKEFVKVNHIEKIELFIKLIVANTEKKEMTDIINSELETMKQRNEIIVDIGSGTGRFLDYFSKKFKKVIEIDFSEKNLKKSKETHNKVKNIEYKCENIITVDFKKNTIDFIFGNWILQYLDNKEIKKVLKKLYFGLRKKGRAIFKEGIKTNFEGIIPDKKQNPAIFRKNKKIYEKWFIEAGFKIIKTGNIKVYENIFNNPNQNYWVLEKV